MMITVFKYVSTYYAKRKDRIIARLQNYKGKLSKTQGTMKKNQVTVVVEVFKRERFLGRKKYTAENKFLVRKEDTIIIIKRIFIIIIIIMIMRNLGFQLASTRIISLLLSSFFYKTRPECLPFFLCCLASLILLWLDKNLYLN